MASCSSVKLTLSCPPETSTLLSVMNIPPLNKMIGNCTQNDVIKDIFGSVSEFARQVEENGDEFLYKDQIVITYDEANDIHYFFYL